MNQHQNEIVTKQLWKNCKTVWKILCYSSETVYRIINGHITLWFRNYFTAVSELSSNNWFWICQRDFICYQKRLQPILKVLQLSSKKFIKFWNGFSMSFECHQGKMASSPRKNFLRPRMDHEFVTEILNINKTSNVIRRTFISTERDFGLRMSLKGLGLSKENHLNH